MGQHDRSEALFYYFRLEDHVPETHLLRLIEKHISFAFVQEKLKASYSDIGRPSIDPELLLRILLIGYLYGITSERSWWRNCACIWRGAGSPVWASIRDPASLHVLEKPAWTVSGSKLFEELFEQIVKQCVEVGLVQGKHLSVDGSFVEANAAKESRIPRQQLAEAAQVNQTVRRTWRNWSNRIPPKSRCISKIRSRPQIPMRPTPPGGHRPTGVLRQLSDRQSQLRDCRCTSDSSTHESGNGGPQDMLARFAQWQGREPIGGGRYDLRERRVLAMASRSSVTPYMRTRDSIHRKRSPFLAPSVSPTNRKTIAISAPPVSP